MITTNALPLLLETFKYFRDMPKFLHTSDFHLNALRKFDNYLERAESTLSEILSIAKAKAVDFIVVAGDINDRLDVSHVERRLLSDWLSSADLPIVLISGNHDKRSSEIGDSCISYLSSLSSNNKFFEHIVHDGGPAVVNKFGCCFVLLPYQGWLDQEFFLIMDALRSSFVAPIIVIMHEAVYGCKTDTEFTVTKRNQIHLDQNSFPEVCYWALGDMHKCQTMLPNAWYCGAPHQTRFDETPDKGVLIVDTADPCHPEFVPINAIKLVTLDCEPVDGWPALQQAMVHFHPSSSIILSGALPSNVKYIPPSSVSIVSTSSKHVQADLFDGLDNILTRCNLQPSLIPLAWRLAIKLAKHVGITIPLPERYQE